MTHVKDILYINKNYLYTCILRIEANMSLFFRFVKRIRTEMIKNCNENEIMQLILT